jgi:hypothetical protein
MKLFTAGRIPLYCEGITHRLETRKSGDVKVVDLTLKAEPFTAQLSAAMNASEYGFVRRVLFTLSDASPIRDYRSIEFKPPVDRQKLICYASVDIPKASIAIDQAKVTKIRARQAKDGYHWTLYLYASFGPLGREELEYVNAFYCEQRWIAFEEAEPSLEFEGDAGDEADEPEPLRPAPMFETEPDGRPLDASATGKPARQLPRRKSTNGRGETRH